MKIVLLLFWAVILSTPVMAQRSTAPDSMVSIPRSLLTTQQAVQLQASDLQSRMNNYGKWVGLGKEVGDAVNSSLLALTTQANTFAETRVGKVTMAIVVWKVVGMQATQLVVGFMLFVVFLLIWQWAFRKLALDHSVLEKVDDKGTKFYKVIEADNDWTVGLWLSLFAFIAIDMMVIFIH